MLPSIDWQALASDSNYVLTLALLLAVVTMWATVFPRQTEWPGKHSKRAGRFARARGARRPTREAPLPLEDPPV